MEGLKELKRLAYEASKAKYPSLPDHARVIHKYSDKSANSLTKCVIDYVNFKHGFAERVANSGRYIDDSKIVTDCLGIRKIIGSGKWIKGSGVNGSADVHFIYKGISVKTEIKMKDSQSEAQKRYQKSIEEAGGHYWIVRSFNEFLQKFNETFQEGGVC